jgi:hypothetical protein
MNGQECSGHRIPLSNPGSPEESCRSSRIARELRLIFGVAGCLLLFSGPVRGRLADPIASGLLTRLETRVLDGIVALGTPTMLARAVLFGLMVVALAAVVGLLASWLASTSRLPQYSFNTSIDARLGQPTLRSGMVAIGLPLTLGLALLLKGPWGFAAVLLFTLLFTAIRLTLGQPCDVLVLPRHTTNGDDSK